MPPHYPRRPKAKAPAVSGFKAMLAADIKATEKYEAGLAALAGVWEVEAPDIPCRMKKLTRRGVLIVLVENAALAYLASIRLRTGMTRKLLDAGGGKVRRVHVTAGG